MYLERSTFAPMGDTCFQIDLDEGSALENEDLERGDSDRERLVGEEVGNFDPPRRVEEYGCEGSPKVDECKDPVSSNSTRSSKSEGDEE